MQGTTQSLPVPPSKPTITTLVKATSPGTSSPSSSTLAKACTASTSVTAFDPLTSLSTTPKSVPTQMFRNIGSPMLGSEMPPVMVGPAKTPAAVGSQFLVYPVDERTHASHSSGKQVVTVTHPHGSNNLASQNGKPGIQLETAHGSSSSDNNQRHAKLSELQAIKASALTENSTSSGMLDCDSDLLLLDHKFMTAPVNGTCVINSLDWQASSSPECNTQERDKFLRWRAMRDKYQVLTHSFNDLIASLPQVVPADTPRLQLLHEATRFILKMKEASEAYQAAKEQLLNTRSRLFAKYRDTLKGFSPVVKQKAFSVLKEKIWKGHAAQVKNKTNLDSKVNTSALSENTSDAPGRITLRFTDSMIASLSGLPKVSHGGQAVPATAKVDLNKVVAAAKKIIGPCVIKRVTLKNGQTVYTYKSCKSQRLVKSSVNRLQPGQSVPECSLQVVPDTSAERGVNISAMETSSRPLPCRRDNSDSAQPSHSGSSRDSEVATVYDIPLSDILCSDATNAASARLSNSVNSGTGGTVAKVDEGSDSEIDKTPNTSVWMSEAGEPCFVTRLLPEDELEDEDGKAETMPPPEELPTIVSCSTISEEEFLS